MGNSFGKKGSKKHKKLDINSLNITSNYFPKNGYQVNPNGLEATARVILMGVYDDNHALSIFRGMRYIIKYIWELTIQFNRNYYSPYIQIKDDPLIGMTSNEWDAYDHERHDGNSVAFKQILESQICSWTNNEKGVDYKNLKLPKPLKKEININMMPIQMNEDKLRDQIPKELHGYIQYIRAVLQSDIGQNGKICYLTIHESYVEKGRTQRRPGLHIEFPGETDGVNNGEATWFYGWGGGYYQEDGIYITSNISNTCNVWNCRIVKREDVDDGKKEIIGDLGDMEHMRCMMPKNEKYGLEKDKLYWITDRTPHEAVPMEKSGWRQFFRLVSWKLGVWYEYHSTKSPIGIQPDPKITKIVKGNKFQRNKLL